MEVRGCRLFHQRKKHLCQQKVAQVIGSELHVESIFRLPPGASHDAGIVDKDVNLLLLVQQLLCTLSDRLEGGQVKLLHLHSSTCFLRDFIGSCPALFHTPAEYDDPGSTLAQIQGSLLANASIGTWKK